MKTSKKIALIGVMTSLAVVLAVLEHFVPIQAVIPLPGIKLGIANVVLLTLLIKADFKVAFSVFVLRCAIVALLFGNPVSLAMSLSGGILAIGIMWLLLHYKNCFSLLGVSVAGATMHNIGQILCACIIMRSVHLIAYLPILLVAGILTGLLNAVLTQGVLQIKFLFIKEKK